MFLTLLQQRQRMLLRQDGPAGGGTTDGATDQGGTEEPAADATPQDDGQAASEGSGDDQDGGEQIQDGEGDGAQPAETPKADGKMVPLAALVDLRKKLTGQLESLSKEIETIRGEKPVEDPLDTYLKGLPAEPDLSTPEGQAVADDRAIFPIIKRAKEHVFPELKQQNQAIGAVLAIVDKLNFAVEQIRTALGSEKVKELGIEMPLGLRSLDKIEALREKTFKESGGKKYLNYQDGFSALQEQAAREAEEEAMKEAGIRSSERDATLKATQQRKAAAGSAGQPPARAVPRTPTGRPRTFAEIEAARNKGQDFGIG